MKFFRRGIITASAEACCDIFNGSTDFRGSGLKVLEGEKETQRRKKRWKEEGESSVFANVMFSWNTTIINTRL